MRFTNKDLKNMIVPLFFEQLLVMLVGIADTLVISYAGESAVSGYLLSISLIRSLSIFLPRLLPAAL